MTDKNIKYAIVICLISLLFAITAILTTNYKYPEQTQGRLLFARSYQEGSRVNHIEISQGGHKTTLKNSDGYWRVSQMADYYANPQLTAQLLTNLNRAVYLMQHADTTQHLNDTGLEQNQVLSIRTFSGDQLIDDVNIGTRTANGLNFVRIPLNGEIWLADGNWHFPADPASWIIQPVLELPIDMVEKIKIHHQIFFRNSPYQTFMDSNENKNYLENCLENFSWLPAESVSRENISSSPETFEVTTFDGLIFLLNLYHQNDSYWLSVTLSTSPLPTSAVSAYISDNAFLYDGWYFKIPAAAGKALSGCKLTRRE